MANTVKSLSEIRESIQQFDFKKLFTNQLGWSKSSDNRNHTVTVNSQVLNYQHIAQLSGVVVLQITAIPDSKTRLALHTEISRIHHEHLLIFVDTDKTQTCWSWLKRDGKKSQPRSHSYFKGQSGDLLLSKIINMMVDFKEFDENGNVPIVEVTEKLRNALDIEPITKKFFKHFQEIHGDFVKEIHGIANEKKQAWYASVLLHRLMFIWFLQKKNFLDKGNGNYLPDKLAQIQATLAIDGYYEKFLKPLFFQGFAKPENDRSAETNKLLGNIRYLNGGLFLEHQIEIDYKETIQVSDKAFSDLFALFSAYSWNLNDSREGNDDEINPDVLGYIFEKYINQKAFGAYYTRSEITDYLCERTICQLILDRVNQPAIPELNEPAGRQFKDLQELLLNCDEDLCYQLLKNILPSISLLDPACGSGAFLVAAMKTLIAIYQALIAKANSFSQTAELNLWLDKVNEHPSVDYFIKKQIITDNLYGVDIMPEATEIAKLRLFLALVSSAHKVEDLEPLPNIDFNIMAGNSLIGLLKIDVEKFEYDESKQSDIFSSKSYRQILNEKNAAIRSYKDATTYSENLLEERKSIKARKDEDYTHLNNLLLSEFSNLKIQFEKATWDEAKNKQGKPTKRLLTLNDIESLQPFHWGYEFDEIMQERGGFDAIITNPPWEVFKPQAKEFFADYSELVTKNKMTIKDFEKEQDVLLANSETRAAWLDYQSRFPFVSLYFRSSLQYPHQTAVVNGKKTGSDINLYKLFTEQCFNLLHNNGQCGVIIPSGIYTDLGATGLRTLLFDKTKISILFGLSNEKFIFEEVHHGFKFCIFSFQKGKSTDNFNAVFRINPREAIAKDKLESFLHDTDIQVKIKTDLVKRLSPDSHSIMEFKNETDVSIAEKMLSVPLLGEKLDDTWNLKLSSEFHMTNDSYLFKTENLEGYLPLYEGKMIHQFSHLWGDSKPKYWINESEAREALLGKNEDNGQILNYQKYRLAYRAVAASTNERALISTIIPPCFAGNSLIVSISNANVKNLLICVSFFNSFIVDWLLRQKVTTNINMFYIYQLPIPRLTETDPQFKPIVERAAALICTIPEFDDLKTELAEQGYDFNTVRGELVEPCPSTSSGRTDFEIRAELDAIIAHLYGLTEAEFAHILKTFPIVKEEIKTAAMAEFKKLAKKQDK
ncbi:MAG: DNA methyltransferase [Methylococcales bacterium]